MSEDYADLIFLRKIQSEEFVNEIGPGWVAFEVIQALFLVKMREAFADYQIDIGSEFDSLAVDNLEWLTNDGFSVEGDEFTGKYLKFVPERAAKTIAEHLRGNEVAKRIAVLGHEALEKAINAIKAKNEWKTLSGQGPKLSSQLSTIEIPASDRIVLKSDNEPVLEQMKTELSELRKLILKDNVAGDTLGDDRDVISQEIDVADQVIESPRFRLASLFGWLLPVLKFLAKRFAGSSIDEVATRLIALLEKLI